MKDLGIMTKFLGIEVSQVPDGIFIHQSDNAHRILDQYLDLVPPPSQVPIPPTVSLRLDTSSEPVHIKSYQALVGQLIFLTKTRPDNSYAMSLLSRFMHSPQMTRWNAALHLISYIAKFPTFGLWYAKGEENLIQGFLDLDYACNLDDRTSIRGYLFTNGTTPISWFSKKQNSTSRSSCESEYRALAKCMCNAIWLCRLKKELGFCSKMPMTVV